MPETEYVLRAYPDTGFRFVGWYEGRVENIYKDGIIYSQNYLPKDLDDPSTLLSAEKEYTDSTETNLCICAVFELCTEHDFGPEQVREATTTEEGCVYHVCGYCGTEEILKVLPKKELISIPKKPSIKKPEVTKNKITVKWTHFKHTKKKAKAIWKKIKKVQVQCATDSGFKNIVKTVPVGKGRTKAVIKGLSKGTTYYVRVRYFDGTGYSNWSKVKRIRTKK
jgi:hypothetical protein